MPGTLEMLDHQFRRFRDPNTAESHFGGEVIKTVTELPSHYWHTNCYAGASFFRPCETPLRHEIGIDRIMWGQDYPHIEATYPYTTEALRNSFAGVATDEVARMVGLNAAGVYGFDLDALAPVAERVGPDRRGGRYAARRDPRRLPIDRLRRRERQALVATRRT